MGQYKSHSAT